MNVFPGSYVKYRLFFGLNETGIINAMSVRLTLEELQGALLNRNVPEIKVGSGRK